MKGTLETENGLFIFDTKNGKVSFDTKYASQMALFGAQKSLYTSLQWLEMCNCKCSKYGR